ADHKITWHATMLPGVKTYSGLCAGPDGLVYGIADYGRFFVFDPVARRVVHEQHFAADLGPTASGQGPRLFVRGPDGAIYLLLKGGIARVDASHNIALLARSPVPINVGGDYLDGRIYFASGSHVYSYKPVDAKR